MRKVDREIAKLSKEYSHANRQEELDFLASLDDLDSLLDTAPSTHQEIPSGSAQQKLSSSVDCSFPSYLSNSKGMEISFKSSGNMLEDIFLERHVLKVALESDALLLWCFKSKSDFPDNLMRHLFILSVSDNYTVLAQIASKSFLSFYEAGFSKWSPSFEDIVHVLNSFQGHSLFASGNFQQSTLPSQFSWHSGMLFRHFCLGLVQSFKHASNLDSELMHEVLGTFLLLCCDRFVNEVRQCAAFHFVI